MTATMRDHDRGHDDRGRPVAAPGPGMSAQVGTAPAGATTGTAVALDGFAFPQLPPEPASPPRAHPPRAVSRQSQREQAESIVNAALAEAERIRDVARAEGYEAGK